MEKLYQYSLQHILSHLIALEEHFSSLDDFCWGDCVPKHALALMIYLEEIQNYAYAKDKEYWKILQIRMKAWFSSELKQGLEDKYASQVRVIRQEIMKKFYLEDFLLRTKSTKSQRGCCQ
jgi:hypothetical protein